MKNLFGILVLLLTGAAVALAAATATGRTVAEPATLPAGPVQALRSGTLDARSVQEVARAANWGGPITAFTGEQVTVFFSPTIPQDPALHQRWADYLASLLHGPEISRVRVFMSTEPEIARFCGRNALACYSPRDEVIVTPAEDVPNGPTAQSVLAHEYAHHIARNRLNPPWNASFHGTKRWASQVNVCARIRDGDLSASATGEGYRRNAGEIHAEHYRVLNERRLGFLELPWLVVDSDLYPEERALVQLQRDVVTPWGSATRIVRRGNLLANGTRTYGIGIPLDGNFEVRVRTRPGVRHTIQLRVGSTLVGRSGTGVLRTTVCGQRTMSVRLVGPRASTFTLEIVRP